MPKLLAAVRETSDDPAALANVLLVLHMKVTSEEEAIEALRDGKCFAELLDRCKLHVWDPVVQLETLKLVTAFGASSPEVAGAAGAVEGVVRILEATHEDLPCALNGVKALDALVRASRENLARAKLSGADDAINAILDMYSREGELQFRATNLKTAFSGISEDDALALAPASSDGPKWGELKATAGVVLAPKSSLPGFSGLSAEVAAKAKEGVPSLCAFLADRKDHPEATMWAMDALASSTEGSESSAAEAVAAGLPGLLSEALRSHRWTEDVVEAAIRLATSLAPFAAADLTEADLPAALLDAMRASDASYQIQSTGVRALLAVTAHHVPALKASLDAGASQVVRAALDTNPEDGQLQWRGMNLLDALKPGQGDEVRERSLRRSYSSFLRRKDSKARLGGSFVERKPVVPGASEAALAEVDEMAEVVEDDDEDEDQE
ncbi:hypothetical protein FNF29_00263 [Cafeteria roenbergensis]|uniref:Uncharacterized protein n=1 Tax=Cafeteria roenbergensis TaxID=33653 RepID=A0A5A8CY26_CAFRO|nr:hypothetical protein FNF29_00263 [Cafeteria roenbergensis]|eukprot:KAA0157688.1 hypothetical protein FNF29_00263 [Cafeteria roenbergensis]